MNEIFQVICIIGIFSFSCTKTIPTAEQNINVKIGSLNGPTSEHSKTN